MTKRFVHGNSLCISCIAKVSTILGRSLGALVFPAVLTTYVMESTTVLQLPSQTQDCMLPKETRIAQRTQEQCQAAGAFRTGELKAIKKSLTKHNIKGHK